MIIRKAKVKDLDGLFRMNRELFRSHLKFDRFYFSPNKNYKEEAEKFLKSCVCARNNCTFIAESGKRATGYIIGHIASRRNKLFNSRKIGSIFELFVKEEYRGQGVAKALMKNLFDWFKEKEVELVEVNVSVNNKIANKAYETFGFKSVMCRKYKKLR